MAARGGYGAQNYSDYNMNGQNSAGAVDAPAQHNPFGYTDEYGLAFLANNADSYANAYNQEKQWLREDMLRREGYQREDTSYTRLFEELKKNGVNPALLLSSVGPMTGSAGSFSTSAAKTSNYEANEKTEQANAAKVVGAIIAALAMIIAAA